MSAGLSLLDSNRTPTPSAFRVARVPALLGKTLIGADEQEGAPAAVVLGYDLWRNRFAGDSDVVGGTIRIGQTKVPNDTLQKGHDRALRSIGRLLTACSCVGEACAADQAARDYDVG